MRTIGNNGEAQNASLSGAFARRTGSAFRASGSFLLAVTATNTRKHAHPHSPGCLNETLVIRPLLVAIALVAANPQAFADEHDNHR